MNEKAWLEAHEPRPLLEFLRSRPLHRKLRLFACACGRRVWGLMTDPRARQAIEVAERFADGLASDEERHAARKAAQQATQARGVVSRPNAPRWARRAASVAYWATARHAHRAAENACSLAVAAITEHDNSLSHLDPMATMIGEYAAQANLLREVVGNPFQPRTLAPDLLAWREGLVPRLAQAIYAERRFGDLPVLADALEEAGCEDVALLDHCRYEDDHTRGCWVIDLLTGRS